MKTQTNTETQEFTVTFSKDEVRLLVTEILCARQTGGEQLIRAVGAGLSLHEEKDVKLLGQAHEAVVTRTEGVNSEIYPMDALLKDIILFYRDTLVTKNNNSSEQQTVVT